MYLVIFLTRVHFTANFRQHLIFIIKPYTSTGQHFSYLLLCASLSVCLSVCVFLSLSLSLSLCLSVSVSVCLCLSLCLSVSMCLSFSVCLCLSVSRCMKGWEVKLFGETTLIFFFFNAWDKEKKRTPPSGCEGLCMVQELPVFNTMKRSGRGCIDVVRE